MIIVQTPLRISFVGGGTDFEDYYAKYGGAVFSTAINKYVFAIIKKRFDDKVTLNYSKREAVDNVEMLRHELVREALKLIDVRRGVEITTLSDVSGEGTGLGSSSSITVAILHALHSFVSELPTAKSLAEEACNIEIDVLKKPIGRQDQYIAAYGNMRLIIFNNSEVKPLNIELSDVDKKRFKENLLLFSTGVTRKSYEILADQKKNINQRIEVLSELTKLAYKSRDAVLAGELDDFGCIMHEAWKLKKQLSDSISNTMIDGIYEKARKAGAIGGKITGAGGGGFLLLYCNKDKQENLRRTLSDLHELPFNFEREGSKVIFSYIRE